MAGNSFGQIFRITTFGESHGSGIGAVIDGCPSGIALREQDFAKEMARRRPGFTSFDTPRMEEDHVEILSGVFEERTTGAPITLFIPNRDVDSRPYEILRDLFRPGHADYAYHKKYGHFDFRGGGRASARETASRVAAGVVARKIVEPLKIKVMAYTLELGGVRAATIDPEVIDTNPLYCPDARAVEPMKDILSKARQEGDSLGGIVEIRVLGCPAGWGEPVFDKLEQRGSRGLKTMTPLRLKVSRPTTPEESWAAFPMAMISSCALLLSLSLP